MFSLKCSYVQLYFYTKFAVNGLQHMLENSSIVICARLNITQNMYMLRITILSFYPKIKPSSFIHTSFSNISLSSVISCIVSCEMVYMELHYTSVHIEI